ncbi:hypothetical protein QP157_15370 [Sphingomonas sp. LR61]|uniref:hypothetical protein n=1 Tax=Sphingomonas sp. LR61 TaxID=3050234 RepID=UPI002FE29546
MADLIVISFDDDASAVAAYEEVQQLQSDLVVELSGLALVRVDDKGKTHVETLVRRATSGPVPPEVPCSAPSSDSCSSCRSSDW